MTMGIGDLVSGVGIVLWLVGGGYWVRFILHPHRIAVLRGGGRWHFLGNLTVVGILVFAAGRVLSGMR